MTTYQGGKKRIGKKIYQVISLIEKEIYPNEKLPYFEPFIGMGGVMRHFGHDNDRDLYACDYNKDLILMWKSLQNGWKPPKECSKEKYEKLKKSKKHSAERAFIGIVASWGGIFFQNYRLDYNKDKDFMGEGYRGLMDIKPDIKNVKFLSAKSYDEFEPKNLLIYCDPPYKGNNLNSKYFTEFSHDKFWEVMREWSKNNLVVISESTAPNDFKKIWCTTSRSTNTSKTIKYPDCLYIHEKYFKLLSKKLLKTIKNV